MRGRLLQQKPARLVNKVSLHIGYIKIYFSRGFTRYEHCGNQWKSMRATRHIVLQSAQMIFVTRKALITFLQTILYRVRINYTLVPRFVLHGRRD